jgi:cytochrome c-type biogenesis protein CcmH
MRRLVLALAIVASPALADSQLPPSRYANVQLADPAKEREAKALMDTLRCVVCQGQAISDSDAEMASDMRALVRQRIAGGESAEQVRTWLIERYGDYITYDPPMSSVSAPLWIAPLALLAIGLLVARASFRRRRRG